VAFGLEIVTTRCRTREAQERALAALDFKLDVLWSLLDAIHHHYVLRAGEGGGGSRRGSPAAREPVLRVS
jgi:pyrroloquinoline-quinone synthase